MKPHVIEMILTKSGVKCREDENFGAVVVPKDEDIDKLIIDLVKKTGKIFLGLDYSDFFIIVPQDDCQEKIKELESYDMYLEKFDKELDPKFSEKSPEKRALDGIIQEASDIIGSEKLFKMFGKAMKVLGDQMGLSKSILDMIKDRGIFWKTTEDGSSIVFYVKNESAGVDQPVAKISADNLREQHSFQEQLMYMVDFATGKAPGSFKQRKQEIQQQEKTIRDISRAVWPSDSSSKISQAMQS